MNIDNIEGSGTNLTKLTNKLCAAMLASAIVTPALAHDGSADKSRVALVYDHALPNVPGKSIRGVLVEYAPGGSSPAHIHPNSAFIYATVLEGAIRSQVNDGPIITYRTGESFSDFPGDRHRGSGWMTGPWLQPREKNAGETDWEMLSGTLIIC